ncbi:MAG: hypothetical protein ACP5KD_05570 [Fervidobacterium sp.]|jgi:ABC-type transport system substrate-binding protein
MNVMDVGSIQSVQTVIVNPMLGYKLDFGEPGIPSGAPASQSVLRVLNQELANYMDFKKQAMKKGGFIIAGGIYLDMQKRGSFLAAVAGETKVLMYIPGENRSDGNINNTKGLGKTVEEDFKKSKIEQKIDELYRKLSTTNDPVEREKLQQQILMLTMAMNALMFGMKIPEILIGALINTTV